MNSIFIKIASIITLILSLILVYEELQKPSLDETDVILPLSQDNIDPREISVTGSMAKSYDIKTDNPNTHVAENVEPKLDPQEHSYQKTNHEDDIQKSIILKAAQNLVNTNLVSASRLFAGPDMYPPREFASYGIFAFRSLPSLEETHRYKMLCQAYLATLPNASTLKQLPTSQQMVTIWPLEDNESAHFLNLLKRTNDSVCDNAIDRYGFITSLQAIKDAQFSGTNIDGSGPFLLAWSPAKKKGQKGFPILAADFSDVTTMKEAKRIFLVWREKIEGDSSTWNTGFIATELRDKLRLMVDSLGPRIWQIFKIGAD